jgi:GTP pyrophosphokinase
MTGAKVNGVIVPIDRIPQNGDIIEIITSGSSKGPSRDWLKIVKTGQARSKIRQWFKKEKRPENIIVGRAEVEKEIKKFGYSVSDDELDEIVGSIAKRVGINTSDDFYNTLGFGGITLGRFLPKIKDELDKIHKDETQEVETHEEQLSKIKLASANKRIHTGGIIIDGESGCQVKFAKCCNPLPGDKIVGFITRGFGVSVHKSDCPKVLQSRNEENLARWVKAEWEHGHNEGSNAGVYEAFIQLHTEDRIGMLADIATALADMRVAILSVNSQKRSNGMGIINLKVSCKNTDHYQSIMSRLKSLAGVVDVVRGYSS